MDRHQQPRQVISLERCLTPDSPISEASSSSGITRKTTLSTSNSEDDRPLYQLHMRGPSSRTSSSNRHGVPSTQRKVLRSQQCKRKESTSRCHSLVDEQGTPQASSHYRSPPPTPNPSAQLETWGSLDEIEALDSWRERTAPWLTGFIDPGVADFWTTDIPRMAHELPATKHMLMAVALLDSRMAQTDADAFRKRSKIIMQHYHEAITRLTTTQAITLDTMVAAILAYGLESLSLNASTALMHLRACGSMTKRCIKSKTGTRSEREVAKHLETTVSCCLSYAESTQSLLSSTDPPRTVSVVTVLNARHAPLTAASLATCIKDFETFSMNFEMQQNSAFRTFDKYNTIGYYRYWEMALIRLRDDRKVPQITLVAAQMLLIMGLSLLPRADGRENAETGMKDTDPAWFVCYMKMSERMVRDCDLNARGREQLEKVVATGLKTILRFAKESANIKESQRLLGKTGYG